MLKLFDEYSKDIHSCLLDTVMKVPVKFREQLCFKGKKVDYSDITKFVLRDGVYTPIMFVPDISENDKIINMFPLICVGMSELLATTSCNGDYTIIDFETALYNHSSMFSDLEKFSNLRQFLSFSDESLENNANELTVTLSLRSDYIACNFDAIKRLTSAMIACYFSNPKFFCEMLLESMKFAYATGSLYTTPVNKISGFTTNSSSISKFDVKSAIPISALSPKRIGYTVPNTSKKHYISSCRGLGIYSYLILFFKIYQQFGVSNSSRTVDIGVNSQSMHDLLQKMFVDCLGDDYTGKYYRYGKAPKLRKEKGGVVFPITYQASIAPNAGVVYTLKDGSKVCRDIYENELLFKRANRVSFNKITDGAYLRNANTYYVNIFSIEGIFYPNTKMSSALLDFIDKSNVDLSKYITKEESELSLQKLRTQQEENIANLHNKYSLEINSYKKKIEELTSILSSKSDIIENLSEELRDSREELQSYYSDEDVEIIENSISIEEAINYINQFSTIMVGGRSELISKLEKYGWTNVSQVDDQNMFSSTPASADFFCINTKFISHRIVRGIESRYIEQRSQMYYFNGTNIENLIFCTYNFIRKWVEN